MSSKPFRHEDVLHRFLLNAVNVRGVLVRLDASWRTIRASADYPPAVARVLGEAVTAVALLGGHTKVDGRLSLQLKGSQNPRTVFAEYRHPGLLRGLAHWQDPVPPALTPRDFGADALMAFTIETVLPGQETPTRYQGLVELAADTLAQACETYFARSEQLPTRLLLAQRHDQLAGIALQAMPGADVEADDWHRLGLLLDTLSEDELFQLPAEALLWRLFHDEGTQLLAEQALRFGCSCSRERVEGMLLGLGEDEAMASIQGDAARITCEFCGRHYRFDRIDLAALFTHPPAAPHATPQ